MSTDTDKIQALIAMAERLTAAIDGDIAALKAGRPDQMRTLDPEVLRLSLLYSREAQSFDPARSKSAPAELKKQLVAVTGKFRDTLKLHTRMLTRVKNASEGLIKAVAEEVDKRHTAMRTYAPPNARSTAPNHAMLFNGVV